MVSTRHREHRKFFNEKFEDEKQFPYDVLIMAVMATITSLVCKAYLFGLLEKKNSSFDCKTRHQKNSLDITRNFC